MFAKPTLPAKPRGRFGFNSRLRVTWAFAMVTRPLLHLGLTTYCTDVLHVAQLLNGQQPYAAEAIKKLAGLSLPSPSLPSESERCKLPQRVRAERGRQTSFGESKQPFAASGHVRFAFLVHY